MAFVPTTLLDDVDRWLTAERAKATLRILAVLSVIGVVAWVALSRHGVDLTGKPLGTDYLSFWTAARMVVQGAPATAPYDPAAHMAAQQAAFPGADVGYTPFPYPPTFLLVCLPFGVLPYLPSLVAWLALTGLGYWRTLKAWAGGAFHATLPALMFPAVLLNLGHGQNAFLSTTLFGTGALLLPKRPFLSGLVLGLLTLKPQLGLLIPVALVAARQWRAIAGAAVSALALAAVATLVFGVEAWPAFLKMAPQMSRVVQNGLLDPGKVQSVFGALRVWGLPIPAAYAAQAVASLAAALAVAVVAWRRPASPAVGPVLVAATLVASPYFVDYDLTLSALPMAWVFAQALRGRFLPGEKLVLAAAYALPLVARSLAMQLHIPLSPLVLTALLAVTIRRALFPPDSPTPVPAPAAPAA